MAKYTKIFAHRGIMDEYPENTIESFGRALELEVDGIETDIQESKDGHLVIIHDEKVDRTTNKSGWVKDFTLAELKRMDAGYRFYGCRSDFKIPTLDEILSLLIDRKFNGELNLEIKNDRIDYYKIEEKVLRLVNKKKCPFKIIFSSFNYHTVARMHHLDNNYEDAQLFRIFKRKSVKMLQQHTIQALHTNIIGYHLNNFKNINCVNRIWMVNKTISIKYCLNKYADAIFTNHVREAQLLRKKIQGY